MVRGVRKDFVVWLSCLPPSSVLRFVCRTPLDVGKLAAGKIAVLLAGMAKIFFFWQISRQINQMLCSWGERAEPALNLPIEADRRLDD